MVKIHYEKLFKKLYDLLTKRIQPKQKIFACIKYTLLNKYVLDSLELQQQYQYKSDLKIYFVD